MIRAFDNLLATQRYMHGALAQPTCTDITILLTVLRRACEKWSYENVKNVSGVDPHVIIGELDIDVPVVEEGELDIYGDLQ